MADFFLSAHGVAIAFGVIAVGCLIAFVCSIVAECRDRKRWDALLKRRPYLSKE